MAIHLIKLCVGCDTIEELEARQHTRAAGPDWRVHTRHTPKRAEELLAGGSLYRVFKGVLLCRQEIVGVETVGEGQAKRCQIVVSSKIVRVAPAPRRPFQGWRYLHPDEAPVDLSTGDGESQAPVELEMRLRELGAW